MAATFQELLSLGGRFHQLGDLARAEAHYRAAAAQDPARPEPHYMLAGAALARGAVAEARQHAAAALALGGEDPDYLLLAAEAEALGGELRRAADLHARRAAILPADATSCTAAGRLLLMAGDGDGAADAFRRALVRAPSSAEAWSGLGNALAETAPSAAADALGRALRFAPWDGGVLRMQGLALLKAHRTREAETALTRAVVADPGHPWAYQLLGRVQLSLGRRRLGLALLARALIIDPAMLDAWLPMHAGLIHERQADKAARVLRHALALAPDFRPAWIALAGCQQDRGLYDDAMVCYDRAERLASGIGIALRRALALPVIPTDRSQIASVREDMASRLDALAATGARLPDPLDAEVQGAFYLAYHACDDRPLQERIARFYLSACPALGFEAPHCARWTPSAGRRIRIGVISQHFYHHTIGLLNLGLVQHLDRRRFEVVVITPPVPPDQVRTAFTSAADRIVEIPHDLFLAQRRIAALELDILYYADVGMAALTYFLAYARLAPLQTLTWGHPDTTGIPNLDHFLSCGAMEPPDAEAHYSEKLARLPGTTLFYPKPRPPEPMKPRAAFGLPEEATLYVCPQSLFKIHPDFDDLLIALLRRDPRALVVLVNTQDRMVAELLMRRISTTAGKDLRPRFQILGRMPSVDFLNVMGLGDVMLDPLHYSGGNTSLEALSLGTPIVTWPGAFMRGRHTHGFYRLMGYEDLVARDVADYLEIALRLGTDPAARKAARAAILARVDRLFEDAASIRAIEDFLEAALAARGTGG
ncbi:O-linked N-acetylglucosamine transferase, SPINDLY family protein [Arenibaculum pallidiluteum]|uniref:O-linked N-acetylglucosamine transferase, SPINDLY family protein n=1 Tax=Arenibaculum pallidiluteum TaxID=2812559 RepID=UPI001A978F5D|nr:glycosyltransferase family 41 protein [Arenibaculum pallidiluteum]